MCLKEQKKKAPESVGMVIALGNFRRAKCGNAAREIAIGKPTCWLTRIVIRGSTHFRGPFGRLPESLQAGIFHGEIA